MTQAGQGTSSFAHQPGPAARNCALCGSHSHTLVARYTRDFKRLDTVCCDGCGLVFSDPMPTETELDAFYAAEYRLAYQGATDPRPIHLARGERRAAGRLRRLAPYLPTGGKVLDLGAGAGEFVAAAQAAGHTAIGIEPTHAFADFARRHYGADVRTADWRSMGDDLTGFHLVTLHHVLEHLPRPVDTLMRLREVLAADGHLYIAVPNVMDGRRTPLGRWHYGHVHHYAPETLDLLAMKAGFVPVDGRGTSRIYRKAGLPATVTPDPAVARHVREFLLANSLLRHFSSPTPYLRFARRLSRGVRVRLAAFAGGTTAHLATGSPEVRR